MNGRLLRGLAASGVLLVGSLALAQSSRNDKTKETPLIHSIEGPELYRAIAPPVTARTRSLAVPRPSR
jgi:hypothetical protein